MTKKILIPFLFIAAFALAIWGKQAVDPGNRKWMDDQIHEDLSFFSKEDLNPERISTSFHNAAPSQKLVHFQIKDSQLYWERNWKGDESFDRVQSVCQFLSVACKKRFLSNVDFLLTVEDGMIVPLTANQYLPVFTFAKKQDVRNGILFPDHLTEIFARTRTKSIGFEKIKPKNLWSKKIEKAFWRGGTTGGQYLADTWHQKPRSKLSLLTRFYPDDIDAGFSVFCQMTEDAKKEMLKMLPHHKWVGHKGHLKYKYLVIADGNTCTYPRFYLGLFSGSVVFKDQTEHCQWFYKALKPYEHYIPVQADFSDLPEKVKWAKENDKKAKQIASNATQFINKNMKSRHIYAYIEKLLDHYSKLQDCDFVISQSAQLYKDSKK
ncbi:MAG: hypothetical protein S4CHLAM6_03830 [Chlamydiae bacterium]|nr:hypothetical protein [Chlamydiota bacterium]